MNVTIIQKYNNFILGHRIIDQKQKLLLRIMAHTQKKKKYNN